MMIFSIGKERKLQVAWRDFHPRTFLKGLIFIFFKINCIIIQKKVSELSGIFLLSISLNSHASFRKKKGGQKVYF